MKVVFLDIDGVLNSDAWFARSQFATGLLDEHAVRAAAMLVGQTTAAAQPC